MLYRLLIILFPILLWSCSKDVDALPEPTQTGANTFGARVNGELWVPQQFGIIPSNTTLTAFYAFNRSVVINARNFSRSPRETEFEIFLHALSGPGVYQLNQNSSLNPRASASYAYYVDRKVVPTGEWITNSAFGGSVNVTTYDTVNHIIAGTFSFTAQNLNLYPENAPVTVSEGRFDIKIQ